MADKKLTELVEISTPVLATDLMYIVRPSLGTDGSKFVPVANLPTAAHTHVFGDIPGLQTALDGKLATGGTAADVSPTGASIAAALAGKAASSHSHAISGVTGLQDALDAKLATNATAVDVNPAGSAIAAALAAKATASHTHPATQISDSTATGRSVLTAADAPAARTAIGAGTSNFSGAYADLSGRPTLGDAAGKNTGTGAGEVAAGNHLHTGVYESVQTAATQAEAEAGTEAGIRSFSPLRIKQAITALGSGGGAPVSAEYLVKTADGTLTAERVVGDSTSVAANWTTAGQVTFTRAALTGDVTAAADSNATTIAAGAVNTAKLGGDITTAGKALLDDADAATQRTTLGLGSLATQSGTFSGASSGTNTGDQTIALTGDVTGSGTGSFAASIAADAVTNAKLANVGTSTIKGRVTAGTGDPEDLTGTQATTLLDVFTSSLKGLAPASGGGTTNFLRADGTWASPPGGGGGVSFNWTAKTTTYTAVTGDHLLADTSGGAFTITLPATPTAGDYIEFNDAKETWATNNLTIARNGSNIDSLAENLVCNVSAKIGLTYINATIGWKVDFIAELGGTNTPTKTYAVFTPLNNQPPATNFATLDTRNSIAVLDFDDGATNESAIFNGIMPEAASLASGLKVRIIWTATTATSGATEWGVQFEKLSTDIDSDSFDTAATQATTTNATSGVPNTTEITITTIDSLAAGDGFRLKVYRDSSDTTNDTMVGDAELIAIEVRSAS